MTPQQRYELVLVRAAHGMGRVEYFSEPAWYTQLLVESAPGILNLADADS